MKFYSLLLLVVFVFLTACSTNDDDGDAVTLSLKADSEIVLTQIEDLTFADIDAGEYLVFKYNFVKAQDPDIADDEYGETIIFQIDPNTEDFLFVDEGLIPILSYFEHYCFCDNVGSIQITDGSIRGTKINDRKWDVTIDVSFFIRDNLIAKQVDGIFILE